MRTVKDFVARVWVAALVSAVLGIGGVWFVVEQSLSSLRGHVGSIDRRLDTFVTTREFDQFQQRMDERLARLEELMERTAGDVAEARVQSERFEARVDAQFERITSAYERTTLAIPTDRRGPFTLLTDRIETSDGAFVVDVAGLSDVQVGFLFGRLVERFATVP